MKLVFCASGPPAITSLAHGASFGKTYAPGMVLSIFGANLADVTWTASSLPLPVQVSGLSVTIGAVKAPLYYASPGQLNVQIPYETPVNQLSTLTVSNNGRHAEEVLAAVLAYIESHSDGARITDVSTELVRL